ncbi:hypothetical protein [Brevibacillus parabrevis]|uniref:hypothetical protein n=1 Tax=Brevibacillus parabrevis TaxID=54914 RepID=UPI001F606E37|nr:hypothetical protein [Brevibacillus parabrevis]MDR5001119.1 hypothetical protein [Brevibacillus parabrevis]
MLKEELLERVRNCGISISSNMIERYVEYGLIVGNRVSLGFSQGVVSHYDEQTLAAIIFIHELKLSRLYKHQKDYIFILYWRGYPVRWDKLKARLIESHTRIMNAFEEIADYTTHPDYLGIINNLANDEVAKAPKSIGRPTRQFEEKQRTKAQENAKRYILVSKLIAGIIKNGVITQEMLRAFNQSSNIGSEIMNEIILESTNNWLQLMSWKNAVRQSDEHDYRESYELIALLKAYWSDLEEHFGSVYDIPIVGNLIQNLENYHQIKCFNDRVSFYRNTLLFLISSGFRQQLLVYLSNAAIREGWKHFISTLPDVLAYPTREEVTVNG